MDEEVELYYKGGHVVVKEDKEESSVIAPRGNHKHADDSDHESSDDEDAVLSWRLDPAKSLSDWTLEVIDQDADVMKEYFVHKSALAVGPRRSTVFAHAFQAPAAQRGTNANANANANHKINSSMESPFSQDEPPSPHVIQVMDLDDAFTRLVLDPKAAAAIPVMLDYIYSDKLEIHTENAVALHYLSKLLEVKALRRLVREYWLGDVSMENLPVYYKDAMRFRDDKVLKYTQEYCAQHIFEVHEQNVIRILTAVDPHFFHKVVSLTQQNDSFRLSLLVAVYCNLHRRELSAEMFLRLTDEQYLPDLEVKASLVLLELEDDICNDSSNLTSLKERAIGVLSLHWDEACFGKDNSNLSHVVLPRLTGTALEIFVKESFANAKGRLLKLQAVMNSNDEKKEIMDLSSPKQLERDLKRAQKENEEIRSSTRKELDELKELNRKLMVDLQSARKLLETQQAQLTLRRETAALSGAESSTEGPDLTL